MKKKTNTKLEVKKLNRMKEQIVRSLSHQFQSLIYDSENMFREIRESIKTIREISKDPTFCNSIPTIEEIDEIITKERFDGWQNTINGTKVIKQKLFQILYKHKLDDDEELFEKAYLYCREHY